MPNCDYVDTLTGTIVHVSGDIYRIDWTVPNWSAYVGTRELNTQSDETYFQTTIQLDVVFSNNVLAPRIINRRDSPTLPVYLSVSTADSGEFYRFWTNFYFDGLHYHFEPPITPCPGGEYSFSCFDGSFVDTTRPTTIAPNTQDNRQWDSSPYRHSIDSAFGDLLGELVTIGLAGGGTKSFNAYGRTFYNGGSVVIQTQPTAAQCRFCWKAVSPPPPPNPTPKTVFDPLVVVEHKNLVAIAWFTNPSGGTKDLMVGFHRGIQANEGSGSGSTAGWEWYAYKTGLPEGSLLGLAFLPDGLLYLSYDIDVSGTLTPTYVINRKGGDSEAWETEMNPDPAVTEILSSRVAQRQATGVRVLETDAVFHTGTMKFRQCRDMDGAHWTAETNVKVGVETKSGGAEFLEPGYVAVYYASGVTYALKTDNPLDWSGASPITVGNGRCYGLAKNDAGALLALVADVGRMSRDGGLTWHNGSGVGDVNKYVKSVIALEGGLFVMIEIESSAIRHYISHDGGDTWH